VPTAHGFCISRHSNQRVVAIIQQLAEEFSGRSDISYDHEMCSKDLSAVITERLPKLRLQRVGLWIVLSTATSFKLVRSELCLARSPLDATTNLQTGRLVADITRG